MKLGSQFTTAELERPSPWSLYQDCAEILGVILDNKFDAAHVHVYEHLRHSAEVMHAHRNFQNAEDGALPDLDLADHFDSEDLHALADEEIAVLKALLIDESDRRLNIIGDVGVGKSTFLLHLMAMHIGQGRFPGRQSIYIDWGRFVDPGGGSERDSDEAPRAITARIERRFVDRVMHCLERHHDETVLTALDERIFEQAQMFATARTIVRAEPTRRRARARADAIQRAWQQQPLEFVLERLNALCAQDRNAVLLVIDNIDHLSAATLREMFKFLNVIQVETKALLLVAMRDHTHIQGKSTYGAERIVSAWNTRLRPPDIHRMLERRIGHLAEIVTRNRAVTNALTGIRRGPGTRAPIDCVDCERISRALLGLVLDDRRTLDFLCSYSNYNIRELFVTVRQVLKSPCHEGRESAVLLQPPAFRIGIDECLIALGLDRYRMYLPRRSRLFNPYSASEDTLQPTDRVVGVRILQLLLNLRVEITGRELIERFTTWGYNPQAVRTQLKAMLHKDLLWSSTGAPIDYADTAEIRLSYRGELYANRIVRRVTFNYMMSFDVDLPVPMHTRTEDTLAELDTFAHFEQSMRADHMATRLIRLADVIHQVEQQEIVDITDTRQLRQFRRDVAPRCIAADILDSLARFLSTLDPHAAQQARYQAAPKALVTQVQRISTRYRQSFERVWSDPGTGRDTHGPAPV